MSRRLYFHKPDIFKDAPPFQTCQFCEKWDGAQQRTDYFVWYLYHTKAGISLIGLESESLYNITGCYNWRKNLGLCQINRIYNSCSSEQIAVSLSSLRRKSRRTNPHQPNLIDFMGHYMANSYHFYRYFFYWSRLYMYIAETLHSQFGYIFLKQKQYSKQSWFCCKICYVKKYLKTLSYFYDLCYLIRSCSL